MSLKSTALQGVLARVKGGKATRMQALVGAIGAAVAVYKLLRSGGDEQGDEQDDATEPNGAARPSAPES